MTQTAVFEHRGSAMGKMTVETGLMNSRTAVSDNSVNLLTNCSPQESTHVK